MTEVIGIDHIYISVSDLERSEVFYDRVLLGVFGFRKNKFMLDGDSHIQYYNRCFSYVLRPSRTQTAQDSNAPGLHHLCLRVDSVSDVDTVAIQLRGACIESALHGTVIKQCSYLAVFALRNTMPVFHMFITNLLLPVDCLGVHKYHAMQRSFRIFNFDIR